MHIDDPWAELGVDYNADAATIKAAWRRLVAQWHPDRNSHADASVKMQRLNRAYEILTTDNAAGKAERRQSSAENSPFGYRAPGGSNDHDDEDRDHDDGFAGGTWRRAPGAKHPKPIARKATVTIEEAVSGCQREFKGSTLDLCPRCAGARRLFNEVRDCHECGGYGRLYSHSYFGSSRDRTCKACDGSGLAHVDCPDCSGSGSTRTSRAWTVTINIPPGVRPGDLLTAAGLGQHGADGEVAPMEIAVAVKEHPIFSFDSLGRLSATVPVDIFNFMAKGTIEVPALGGGTVHFDLSKGASQTLPGEGAVDRAGHRGPLVLQAVPVPPRELSVRERLYLQALASDQDRDGFSRCAQVAQWRQNVAAFRAASAGKNTTKTRPRR